MINLDSCWNIRKLCKTLHWQLLGRTLENSFFRDDLGSHVSTIALGQIWWIPTIALVCMVLIR